MSKMIEVYLREDQKANSADTIAIVVGSAGRLTHEESNRPPKTREGICLTFEFDLLETAQQTMKLLEAKGIHVEGPYDY